MSHSSCHKSLLLAWLLREDWVTGQLSPFYVLWGWWIWVTFFMSGQFSLLFLNILQEQNLLFQVHFDSYFFGNILVPGLDWNGATFPGTLLLEHFWSLKIARGKIQNYANMATKFKVQSCTNMYYAFIICVLKFATKICNKSWVIQWNILHLSISTF